MLAMKPILLPVHGSKGPAEWRRMVSFVPVLNGSLMLLHQMPRQNIYFVRIKLVTTCKHISRLPPFRGHCTGTSLPILPREGCAGWQVDEDIILPFKLLDLDRNEGHF